MSEEANRVDKDFKEVIGVMEIFWNITIDEGWYQLSDHYDGQDIWDGGS